MDNIRVLKRDGTLENLNLTMIHDAVDWACNGYENVSTSDIEINSKLQLFDQITTEEIQKVMIRSAADLISKEKPNYQFVAARLLLMDLRKKVYKQSNPIPFEYLLYNNINGSIYDKVLLKKYSKREIVFFGKQINYDRDYLFTYAGLRQMTDKYLLQDRYTGELFETPQEAFMLIGMYMFKNYKKEERKKLVVEFYEAISTHKISLPTPIMSGVRTPLRQYSSCCLIDVGDSLKSILNSNTAVGYYTANRAGIGLNIGRIRGIDASIRNGEVIHTGLVPFLKIFESTTKGFTQNSIRGGGSTATMPFFHWEIEMFMQLKNNKGNDENRVRRMDYSIALNGFFRDRVKQNKDIVLFSMEEVTDLYEAFYSSNQDEFKTLYEKYESDSSIRRKKVNARELYLSILKERYETGRIYILNADHVNTHSAFKDNIYMSNLCQEITLPTAPFEDVHKPEGELAMCILSNINIGKIDDMKEIDTLTNLLVRFLDELIDYQDYPVLSAEKSTKRRRSLGIGISDLFHLLAKKQTSYKSQAGRDLIHLYMERFQYGLLKASNELAKEKGACEAFSQTKYADGIMPVDTYCKNVDELISVDLMSDWDTLRKDIKKHGLRNSTLSAIPPAASSSIVSNSTAGIDPPRRLLIAKTSKYGPLKQLVPDFDTIADNYETAWKIDNVEYVKMVGVIQKFLDQSISTNQYYVVSEYDGGRVPVKQIIKDETMAYKYGLKTLYYLNTHDNSGESSQEKAQEVYLEESCEGGACSV